MVVMVARARCPQTFETDCTSCPTEETDYMHSQVHRCYISYARGATEITLKPRVFRFTTHIISESLRTGKLYAYLLREYFVLSLIYN